jgi:spore maturation protein CgeB
MRSAYQPFRDHGYRIISVEFGANPLVYYPVPGVTPDLDYVFLGSSNRRKQERYVRYFSRIVKHHVGLFQGPGFRFTHVDHIKPARDRYLLSRGRVGLNLSVPSQLSFPAELNERTYQLAACGVPQLIDHPQLLFKRFPQNAVFCGSEPDEYYRLFLHMLDQRDEARDRAMNALHTVYRRHSTFHRAADFLRGIGQVRAPA